MGTTPLVGYVRVSSDAQKASGIGIAAQRKALEDAAADGLRIGRVFADEGLSGSRMSNRPGLRAALAEIAQGRASGLIVPRIDRLGRSYEVMTLVGRAAAEGWRLVALDVGLDTTTAEGELVAGALTMAARFEWRRISQRQHDKFAELRRQGRVRGRPGADRSVADRIISLRDGGATWQSIADTLNTESVPTVRSGRLWRTSSVRSAYVARQREIEAQSA
jgi:DNA invertase Pin-like site-specific DNA recombinase